MPRKRLTKKQRASLRRTKQILGIPTSVKDARGLEGEKAVLEALKVLKEKGVIIDFIRTMKYSGDDLSGVDFRVRLSEGENLPLQVKTYFNPEEIESYRQRGILPVIIRLFDEEGQRKPYSKVVREAKRAVSEVIAEFRKAKEMEKVIPVTIAEPERPISVFTRFLFWLRKLTRQE